MPPLGILLTQQAHLIGLACHLQFYQLCWLPNCCPSKRSSSFSSLMTCVRSRDPLVVGIRQLMYRCAVRPLCNSVLQSCSAAASSWPSNRHSFFGCLVCMCIICVLQWMTCQANTVNVLYTHCTCPSRNCHYTKLLLEQYNNISNTYVVGHKLGNISSNQFQVASMSFS